MRTRTLGLTLWSLFTICGVAHALPVLGQKSLIVVPLTVDGSQFITPAAMRDVILNEVNAHYRQDSYGQMSFVPTVLAWAASPPPTSCVPLQMRTLGQQAAAVAGVDLSTYAFKVYVFSGLTICGGTVGFGLPGEVFLIGRFRVGNVAHELGHAMSLYHTAALSCSQVALGPTCSVIADGDPFSVMNPNYGPLGGFGPFEKERVGWLTATTLLRITEPGDYRLDVSNTPLGALPKAASITRNFITSSNVPVRFYLERRKAVGVDSGLAGNDNALRGIWIRLNGSLTDSQLLNMTPETGSFQDAALTVGRTFTDAVSGVSITPTALDGDTVTIAVAMAHPKLMCSPVTQTVPVSSRAALSASGGDGTFYGWSDSWWEQFTTEYFRSTGPTTTAWFATPGTYQVSVASGPQVATCTVVVGVGSADSP